MKTRQILLALFFFICGYWSLTAQDSLTVQFGLESHRLTTSGKSEIEKTLLQIAPIDGYYFQVIGHTDSKGPNRYNMKLSQNRAKSVRDFLVKLNIESEIIVYNGQGEKNPEYDNKLRANRIKNRRVVVRWRRNSDKAAVPVQIFDVYNQGVTLITSNKGCEFEVKGSDFRTLDGKPVKDGIQLFLKEYDSPAEFVLGEIPMDDHQNETMYESYSMFSVNAFKDTVIPLKIANNGYMSVKCNLPEENEDIDFFKFDKFEDSWSNLGNAEDIAMHGSKLRKEREKIELPLDSLDGTETDSTDEGRDKVTYGFVPVATTKKKTIQLSNGKEFEAQYSKSGKYIVAASMYPEELLGKEQTCNTDLCYFGENLNGLQFFTFDPGWYDNAKPYLNEKMVGVNYKKSLLLKKAKVQLELNPYMFTNGEEITATKWKHKIKGKKSDFATLMHDQTWNDIHFEQIDESKKYYLMLKSDDRVDTLILRDSWWNKAGKYIGREEIEDLPEMKSYLTHVCFWKRNQPFMSTIEKAMTMHEWFDQYQNQTTVYNNRFQYFYAKKDSILKQQTCLAEGGKALDSKSDGSIIMRELGIYNYDKVISTKDFLKVELSFKDQNGVEINPIYTYTIIQSLNGLLQFKSTIKESTQEIKTKAGVCTLILVEDAAGNIWISEGAEYDGIEKGEVILRKVSEEMKSHDKVKELLNFSCKKEG